MKRAALIGASAAALAFPAAAGNTAPLDFSPLEIRRILQHGPWPPPAARDPSNRVSGDAEAIALGERLFFDPRLSATGTIACSSCHVPEIGWTDLRARAEGLRPVDRNTPALVNVRLNRWFGWDGANDNLWAQSIRPILDPREMDAGPAHVARLVRRDPELNCRYQKIFGFSPEVESVLVNIGKALAAFQETLASARTPFDEFRDALEGGDREAAARYPLAAQRGLRTFIGRGACSTCHFGPDFTNGEFHDTGIPFFISRGKVDPGRHGGIAKLKESRYNLLGPWNDDPKRADGSATRHVAAEQRNFGEFKVPSLRNVALTAPYMHNGSLATLRDVVKHYSDIDPDRVHSDGEQILKPLRLSEDEIADLVAFLESLTESGGGTYRRLPMAERSPCR